VSQENAQIVRGLYEAFTRRDAEAPFASYAPDIEWDITRLGHFGVATVYHGHEGVRASFRDILAAFRDFAFEPVELKPSGEHVLVTVHEHGVGRGSGVVVDRRHYALWTLRNGMVIRMWACLDQAEALRAASLSE
jgi:ketosteroid isomerase-like protein